MLICLSALAVSCEPAKRKMPQASMKEESSVKEDEKKITPIDHMVKVQVVNQGFRYDQPWNKKNVSYSSGFGLYLGNGLFLTNAAIVNSAEFIELLSPDNSKTCMAAVKIADFELNLAILQVDEKASSDFLEDLVPLELAEPLSLGDKVEIWQFNEDGLPFSADGVLESAQLAYPFSTFTAFVLYQVKSAVAPVMGGMTMPLMDDGKLAGISLSCEQSSQNVLSLGTPLIKDFLDRALSGGKYEKIPVFGVEWNELLDPVFRKYLKLSEKGGGVYIQKVLPYSSAEQAGLLKGDVIESVNGLAIDGRGIVQDAELGPVPASYYWHDQCKMGDVIDIVVKRSGEQKTFKVKMNRDAAEKALIPEAFDSEQPRYLVAGGFVFQPLSRMLLSEFYDGNTNRMPLTLLEMLDNEKAYRDEGRNEIILLTSILPTTATHGYGSCGMAVVTKVDGKVVKDLNHLAEIFDEPSSGDLIKIEINKPPFAFYASRKDLKASDLYIRKTGVSRLRNL